MDIARYGMQPRLGIGAIIDQHAAHIRSIANCASEHIRLAKEASEGWAGRASQKLSTSIVGYTPNAVLIDNRFHEEISNHLLTPPSEILAQALLTSGFSVFDAFLGRFLAMLYREERSLLNRLDERDVKLADIIDCKSVDDVLDKFVHKNVEKLIRESYTTIFTTLARWHGLGTLQAFPAWPDFIEASQRRHLITHCDGVVSSQYIEVCRSAKCKLPETVVFGKKLTVDLPYLSGTLQILYEVIIMLGLTLWRTASPRFVEPAGVLLTDEIFSLLDREQWQLAKTLGKFAIELPDQNNDLQLRISRINYAQALKWSGDHASAINVLDKIDCQARSRIYV